MIARNVQWLCGHWTLEDRRGPRAVSDRQAEQMASMSCPRCADRQRDAWDDLEYRTKHPRRC